MATVPGPLPTDKPMTATEVIERSHEGYKRWQKEHEELMARHPEWKEGVEAFNKSLQPLLDKIAEILSRDNDSR